MVEVKIVSQPWSDVVFAADGFPPLYQLIFKAAYLVTDNDLVGRWLSVLFGALAVPLLGLLTWRLANGKAALFASTMLAINPLHVYFSQEGRSYALFFLLCVLAIGLYLRAVETSSVIAWMAFGFAASLGGYVHYYFGFVLLALGIIWLKQASVTTTWKQGGVTFSLVAVAQLPLLMLLRHDIGCQQSMQQTFLSLEAVGYTGWAWLTGFCLGPSLKELHEANLVDVVQRIQFWLVPLLLVSLYWLVSGWNANKKFRIELLLLLLIPLIATCAAAIQLQISYNVRYVVPCLAPLVIWLAVALSEERKWWLQLGVCLILVVASATSLANRQWDERYFNEDARKTFEYIAAQPAGPSTVYTMSNYMGESAEYFLPDVYNVVQIDDIGIEGEGLPVAIELLNHSTEPFWIFYCREFHGDPARRLRQVLTDCQSVELIATWPGVELYRGKGPLKATPR